MTAAELPEDWEYDPSRNADADAYLAAATLEPGDGAIITPPHVDTGHRFVTLDSFVNVEELGAAPIVGEPGSVIIPEAGDVMIFGDGGAGKTTLQIDLAFHLAAGQDWCGLQIAKPVTVAIVENEGPRPLFRDKLRRKRDAWKGEQISERLHVLEHPWATFTFANESHREWLAQAVTECELSIVILGPLTRVGMNEAGTLQETRDFAGLLADVRNRTPRPVTFALIHHENKAGEVSGAWEGAGDTLLHVTGQGHGRTKLHIRKARWSSEWHGKTLNLTWAEGESFTVDEAPERDDNSIADRILQAARAQGGASWNTLEKAAGCHAELARRIRDRLLASGLLHDANATKSTKSMALWDAQDPLRPTVLEPDAPRTHHEGEEGEMRTASTASALKKDAVVDADAPRTPSTTPHPDDDIPF